jgi:hypothetical protein
MKETRRAHALLDALRQESKLRSDSHLAEELGYRKSRICEYRAGHPVSAEFIVAVQRKYGWSMKKIDALLAPRGE